MGTHSRLCVWLVSLLVLGIGSTCKAAVSGNLSPSDSLGNGSIESLTVPLYKSRVLRLSEPATRVSIGNPDIADILIVRATQLYVLGKDLGTTNVHLWDRRDNLIGTVSVEVTHDIESLKFKLHQLLPGEQVEVFTVQRTLILKGRVSSVVAMQSAVRMAEAYLAEVQTATRVQEFQQSEQAPDAQVINMMEVSGGQQVMLEVKVAEVARSELRRMNARFNLLGIGDGKWDVGGVNGGTTFPDAIFDSGRLPVPQGDQWNGASRIFNDPNYSFGPPLVDPTNVYAVDEFAPNPLRIEDQGLFASFLSNSTMFNVALDVAKEKGLAKILAEPTLTTLTGQEADFLSGGEFPIPVPRGDNGVTIQFKEFGVALKFLPVVLDSNKINVKVNVAVSELINANSVGIQTEDTTTAFVIPALSKRSANATVELKEGQTMGIAGMINENMREVITKFPGLGDLPVLGALFRSQEFQNNETELVITVTPHIAKPMRPDQIKLPTDTLIEPSDVDFYLMGRLEGRPKSVEVIEPAAVGTGVESSFGHSVE